MPSRFSLTFINSPALPSRQRRYRPTHQTCCTRPPKPPPKKAQERNQRPPEVVHPTQDQVVSRLTACARRSDWYAARSAFLYYIYREEPSQRVVGAYVNALCRSEKIEDAYQVLDQYPDCDGPMSRTSVIAALTRVGRVDEALQELRSCIERGIDMSGPQSWTAVMHGFGVDGRAYEAGGLLEEAIEKGVEIDGGMFDAVIRAYGRIGRLKESFAWLGKMRKGGYKVSESTFEGLIYACVHAGEAPGVGRRAFVVWDAAKVEGKNGIRVIGAIASACLKSGGCGEKGKEVLEEMEKAWKKVGGSVGVEERGVDAERFWKKKKDLKRLIAKLEEKEKGKEGGGESGWEWRRNGEVEREAKMKTKTKTKENGTVGEEL